MSAHSPRRTPQPFTRCSLSVCGFGMTVPGKISFSIRPMIPDINGPLYGSASGGSTDPDATSQRPRQLHHLCEQIVQGTGVPRPKLVQRPKVRPRSGRQITERQVLPHPLFQTAGRGHAQRVGIQPHLQQQRRMIGRAAFFHLALLKRTQFQPLHDLVHKKTDVIFSQHLPHAGRQQIRLLRVALLRNSRSRRTGPRSSSASVHALRSWHSKLRHPVQHSALDRGFDFLVLDRAGREAYPEYRLVP